jgi:hypothetical protein
MTHEPIPQAEIALPNDKHKPESRKQLVWRDEYDRVGTRALKKHFGDSQGITWLFPYMKADFKWRGEAGVADARTALKSNNEYHGLERHARQYHVTGQYEEAYEHWILAATWRREVMMSQGIGDAAHQSALDFALRNARYNKALFEWQKGWRFRVPKPARFGLDARILEKKDREAERQINDAASTILS